MIKYISQIIITSIPIYVFSSCTNSVKECNSLVAAVVKADSSYYSSQSQLNCVAYKNAMQAWLNEKNCASKDATTQLKFQQEIAALNCQ
jgi:hypothetical protein